MVGGWEWVLIILAIFLVFGAKRIPDIAKGLGQGIRSFKKELRDDEEGAEGSDDKAKPDDTSSKQDDSGPTSL